MTTEVRGGLEAYHRPKNTPDRRLVPEATLRTNIFGNGVGPRECPGVSEEWYFNTTTRTYEPVEDRTNGSK
ncbi:hypothetical protein HYS96_01760 [Candidatus Daviesbacteria bacterium]|nr:hypothetical protein [Candidatus Daviesbacteria bacterium]